MTALDIGLLAGIPVLFAAAWLLPTALWDRFAYRVAPLVAGMLSRGQRGIIDAMQRFLRERAAAVPPQKAARQLVAAEIMSKLQIARDHVPWRWRPPLAIEGLAHIEHGLAAGNGVILWDSHFYFASLMTKVAMASAGHRAVHLSQPTHGFSSSRFGIRVFNPLRTKAEDRYIAKRVVLSPQSATAAMRTLINRLGRNEVVSITVRARGARSVTVPLMAGEFTVATGAPDLAFRCGAALLPVFTLRMDDGSFKVIVEPPIQLPPEASRRAAAEAAAREYVRRLEPRLLAHPGQWMDWLSL